MVLLPCSHQRTKLSQLPRKYQALLLRSFLHARIWQVRRSTMSSLLLKIMSTDLEAGELKVGGLQGSVLTVTVAKDKVTVNDVTRYSGRCRHRHWCDPHHLQRSSCFLQA